MAVELAMSVNKTVASTRSMESGWRRPVRNRPQEIHSDHLLLCRLGAIGAVHRISLMIDAEILADGAWGRIDGIGRPHHLAVPGDGVLTLQHLQHDGA